MPGSALKQTAGVQAIVDKRVRGRRPRAWGCASVLVDYDFEFVSNAHVANVC